ncbi:MAG: hypothetical protein K2G47_03430 [Muribaculum sp.]|nr:hypothetical protein [Muribaculum sp.]
MNKISHIISWVLSPVLIPTYAVFTALWVTMLALLPVGLRINVVLMTFLLTCVVPVLAIILLYKMKIVSHPGLNHRKERYIPYVITAICYLGAAWYMYRIHAPEWMYMFMTGGAIAAVVSCIVNAWWKISAHLAAMSGYVALLFRILSDGIYICNMWVLISVAILLTGLLGSARIQLRCHTFWQVIAGAANGFFWVYLLTSL